MCCLFVLYGLFIVAVLVYAIYSKWTVDGITSKKHIADFTLKLMLEIFQFSPFVLYSTLY